MRAVFAAGCFWGVEHMFRKHWPQLTNVTVGYASSVPSNKAEANYKSVCTGKTPFAEAVAIDYDPNNVSYKDLVDFFFRIHDPTTVNSQGPDIGTQYRSVIFIDKNTDQYDDANSVKEIYDNYYIAKHGKHVKTAIEQLESFIPAEEYHQLYLTKNPSGYECPTHFLREKAI